MGFFKKTFKRAIKTAKSLSRKAEKQAGRPITTASLKREVIRSSAKINRELGRTGIPPEVITVLLALTGVGLIPALILQGAVIHGEFAELKEKAEKLQNRQRRALARVQQEKAQKEAGQVGLFASIGTSLLSGLTSAVVPAVPQVATQVVQQKLGDVVTRALGGSPRQARTARALPAALPAGPDPRFLPGAFPTATGLPIPLGRSPTGVGQLEPAMIPGIRVEVPRFPRSPSQIPAGSDKLQAVLLADGTVGFVVVKKRRRMNVLNPRALNRAVRRVDGFTKFVKRSRKGLRKLAKL